MRFSRSTPKRASIGPIRATWSSNSAIGHVPRWIDEGGLAAATLMHVAVHEVDGGIVLASGVHVSPQHSRNSIG